MANIALFLQLQGITGSVVTAPYAGQIAVLNYNLGVNNVIQHGLGKVITNKFSYSNLTIVKNVDIASIALLSNFASATPIPSGTLSVVSMGANNTSQLLYSINILSILVVSISSGAAAGDIPANETVSLYFDNLGVTWNVPPTAAVPHPTSPTFGWNAADSSYPH